MAAQVSYLASFVVLASVQAHMLEEVVGPREEAPESVQGALQVQVVELNGAVVLTAKGWG